MRCESKQNSRGKKEKIDKEMRRKRGRKSDKTRGREERRVGNIMTISEIYTHTDVLKTHISSKAMPFTESVQTSRTAWQWEAALCSSQNAWQPN